MRYVRAIFRHDDGALHPWGAALTADPAVTRGPMYEMELMEDGTGKVLCHVYGDAERGYELTRDHELVREVEVSGDDPGLLYIRVEMPPVPRKMLEFPRKTSLILSMPIRFTPDGGSIATFVGDDAAFTESLTEVPEDVDVELVDTGTWDPEPSAASAVASLTPHQQQILRAALEVGYYECPREATQADVAEQVDLAPGTVGQHLRKIESRVFTHLIEGQ